MAAPTNSQARTGITQEKGMMEPRIVINEVALTEAQACTVRVALSSFATSLSKQGLGKDDLGIAIRDAYLARLSEIQQMIDQVCGF
jgi:hypothetical protein